AKAINRFDNPELHFYRGTGVFVFGIKPRTPAAASGLLRGDINISINGKNITDLEGLLASYMSALKNVQRSRRASLTIMRNGVEMQIPINMMY
ncbi:MAG: PDZ domain-containing protein, partial [Lentisphaeria bacterium]|nr:PDZ domain-containing protein [Lentisphaeria bacterium]